eukprot:5195415-Heterocapsa_arctica.AAC.1
MTEEGLKDIDKSLEREHYSVRDRFQDVMDCMDKMKRGEMEEERTKTEGSEEEEEELMTGAIDHDMNKWQESDIRKWLNENPTLKADAMRDFDEKLMDGIEGTDR